MTSRLNHIRRRVRRRVCRYRTDAMDVNENYSFYGESLQNVLENLPGIDPESEEMRYAIGALTEDTNNAQDKAAQDDDNEKNKK